MRRAPEQLLGAPNTLRWTSRLWNRHVRKSHFPLLTCGSNGVTHSRISPTGSRRSLASGLHCYLHAIERVGRPERSARFHAGASAPRSRSLLHGIFGIAPFRATYEPRGATSRPVLGWIEASVSSTRIAAASAQRVRPPLPLRQFEARETPSSKAPLTEGGCIRWHPPPLFFRGCAPPRSGGPFPRRPAPHGPERFQGPWSVSARP